MSSSSTTDGNSPTTNLPETEFWSTIESTTFKIKINLIVKNLSFYLEDNPTHFTPILSPEYSPPGHEDVRFFLGLYPNSQKVEDKDYLSLYLYCQSANFPSPVYAKYKMSFVDGEGNDRHLTNYQYKFIKNEGYGSVKMLARFVVLDPANVLLPNDQLMIRCEATICIPQNDKSGISAMISTHTLEANSREYEDELISSMTLLLANNEHSDVTLCLGGMKLPAHKGILSVRSPVFAAMFSYQDTKEAQEGKVEIDDVSTDVFRDLLRFIYTGKIPAKQRMTTELLAAADKYQVESLKSACESHLSNSLSMESVATTLLFADMHNAASLKAKCIKFISGNIFAAMSTEAWINMAMSRPELMLEISNLTFTKTGAQEGSK